MSSCWTQNVVKVVVNPQNHRLLWNILLMSLTYFVVKYCVFLPPYWIFSTMIKQVQLKLKSINLTVLHTKIIEILHQRLKIPNKFNWNPLNLNSSNYYKSQMLYKVSVGPMLPIRAAAFGLVNKSYGWLKSPHRQVTSQQVWRLNYQWYSVKYTGNLLKTFVEG